MQPFALVYVNGSMNTSALPICLIPADLVSVLSTDELERFEFKTYVDAPTAWKIAEQHDVACFISDLRFTKELLCGLLSGLQIMSPDFVHIHVFQTRQLSDVLSVINRAGTIRMIAQDEVPEQLPGFLADAFMVWMRNRRKDQQIAELRESNQQYEFMLRQSLLS